jgi:hypothetical protein
MPLFLPFLPLKRLLVGIFLCEMLFERVFFRSLTFLNQWEELFFKWEKHKRLDSIISYDSISMLSSVVSMGVMGGTF